MKVLFSSINNGLHKVNPIIKYLYKNGHKIKRVDNISDNLEECAFQQEIVKSDILWLEYAENWNIHVTQYILPVIKKYCKDIPTILRIHNQEMYMRGKLQLQNQPPINDFLYKLVNYKMIDRVVFSSIPAKNLFFAEGQYNPYKQRGTINYKEYNTDIIPLAVDTDIFKFNTDNKNPKTMLIMNDVHTDDKGIMTALEIFNRLYKADNEWTLHLSSGNIPNPVLAEHIIWFARENGFNNSMRTYQGINPNNKNRERETTEFISRMQFIVSGSYGDLADLPITEAIFNGTIPIIKQFRGAEDIYNKDFLYLDTNEAVEKINYYLANGCPDSLYKKVIENQSLNVVGKKVVDMFNNLLQEKNIIPDTEPNTENMIKSIYNKINTCCNIDKTK